MPPPLPDDPSRLARWGGSAITTIPTVGGTRRAVLVPRGRAVDAKSPDDPDSSPCSNDPCWDAVGVSPRGVGWPPVVSYFPPVPPPPAPPLSRPTLLKLSRIPASLLRKGVRGLLCFEISSVEIVLTSDDLLLRWAVGSPADSAAFTSDIVGGSTAKKQQYLWEQSMRFNVGPLERYERPGIGIADAMRFQGEQYQHF